MKKGGEFWVGFSDLMTSLFFVMLVLYCVSFVLYQEESKQLEGKISELENMKDSLKIQADQLKIQADKFKIIELVEKNLSPLKERQDLFKYDNKYKRFNLSFDVGFETSKFKINKSHLTNSNDIKRLEKVGHSLEKMIRGLHKQKQINPKLKGVSYLIVISGSASDDGALESKNYPLSYKRAYYLYKFWQSKGIDLDQKKYHNLVDFHIAGNGTGGVGRYIGEEKKNQRFIINIIPKIGEIK